MITLTYDKVRAIGEGIRLHGNGFVQLNIEDLRLHIWHCNPAIKAQKVQTQIHNHKFSFVSQVVEGMLLHTVYKSPLTIQNEQVGKAYHQLYKAIPRNAEDTQLVLDTHAKFTFRTAYELQLAKGSIYTFESGIFHESGSLGFTATIMRKTNVETMTPLVACKSNEKPDNDFDRYQVSEDALWGEVSKLFNILHGKIEVRI